MTRGHFGAGLCLAVLTTLAYLPGLTSPFTRYDDPLYVTTNLDRLSPAGWSGLALQFNSDRAWAGDFVEYFPLRDAVYWANFQLFGLDPLPYHLTSFLFHLVSSLLVWLFFTQLGLSERAAWLGALLFALHPVHVESVVWVAGLKDPMYTMCMMTGLCAYASYRVRPSVWKYALMLVGLCCGFLVKSLIIAMPIILLGMELLIGARARLSEIALRLIGPFIIAAVFFGSILGVGRANGVLLGPHGGSWSAHAVLALWAQVKYLKQALVPTSFRLIYCFEPPTGLSDWRLWVGLATLAAVGALLWYWRREPVRLFLLGFYVAAILPVSNLVPFPAVMADRYLYAPSIATCGILAILSMGLRTRSFLVVTAAIAVALTATTASRAWVWQTEELLWEEPDLDPACLVDTAYPAAQSHILRYLTTSDRHEGLLALERTLMTPGLNKVGHQLLCTTLIGATREAQELGGEEQARAWATLSTTLCHPYAAAWNVAMVVNLHKRLDLAAGAATKAWRLEKSPETEVLMWLTRLEFGDQGAAAEVLRLSHLEDRLVCEKIAQFSIDAPSLAPTLGEANFHCMKTLTPR